MPDHTVAYTVEIKPAGVWLTIPAGAVLDVSGSEATGGSDDNPFAFGENPTTQHTVKTFRPTTGGYTWERTPIRITTIIDGVSVKSFTGIIKSYQGDDAGTLTWVCVSFTEEVSVRSRDLYSQEFVATAVATATTATSVEDPANPNYAAGPVNWGFWMTGGRPSAQAASYPTADYYYSCEHALIAPDVAWFAGEDGWQVMLQLAQASGGQIYQDSLGVLRYRQVLNVGSVTGVPSFTFASTLAQATDSFGVYESATDQGSAEQYATLFVASYTPRNLRPMQEIINDTTVHLINAGASYDAVIEPQWPIHRYELIAPGILADDKVNVVFLTSGKTIQGASGYDQTVTTEAQRITIQFLNNTAWPIVLRSLKVNGEPWLAGETGRVEQGSGTTKRDVVDNIFIQYEDQTVQLVGMHVAFEGVPHPIVTIAGCPFDTRRSLGEIVYLTSDELGIVHDLHVIVGREITNVDTVDYKLALLGTAPVGTDFYEIGSTVYTGANKYVAW